MSYPHHYNIHSPTVYYTPTYTHHYTSTIHSPLYNTHIHSPLYTHIHAHLEDGGEVHARLGEDAAERCACGAEWAWCSGCIAIMHRVIVYAHAITPSYPMVLERAHRRAPPTALWSRLGPARTSAAATMAKKVRQALAGMSATACTARKCPSHLR